MPRGHEKHSEPYHQPTACQILGRLWLPQDIASSELIHDIGPLRPSQTNKWGQQLPPIAGELATSHTNINQ